MNSLQNGNNFLIPQVEFLPTGRKQEKKKKNDEKRTYKCAT